ncbi:MAG: hypothetical protein EOT05_02140 [Candidatus Microsaccharimonas sossegonensis]|uniref:Uncharacterized protein n=1 Tax=Candidatus Microsaccharimonas sossegonensis TaxID=2506948 RepID=A0A4Q0AHS8_9BACT|nr:MAG: hypothetical protein EOT05_02140 [Candidatus Microsaccharimonas sossegonensis]
MEQSLHTSEINEDDMYKTVEYEDGGSSAIVVNTVGATVDLKDGDHKYLKSPERNPAQEILISGYTEGGEKVKLVIDGNYAVAFGVDKDGKQFAEVSHTQPEDLAALRQPIKIGQPAEAWNGMIVTSVAAQYKSDGGGATEKLDQQNPFSIAERLVQRAKRAK